jgi:hypothetical protein
MIPERLLLWYEMSFVNSKRKIADSAARKSSRGRNSRPRIWNAAMRKFPILKAGYDRISVEKIYVNKSSL